MALGRRVLREFLNHLMGKTPDTTPAGVVYLSLHTGNPGVDGQTSNEATGSGYARKACTAADWNAATLADPTLLDNATLLAWATATGDWSSGANFTYVGIWNHATNTAEANFVGAFPIATPRNVLNGDTMQIPIGFLDITIDATP